jgi:hypothetical protein
MAIQRVNGWYIVLDIQYVADDSLDRSSCRISIRIQFPNLDCLGCDGSHLDYPSREVTMRSRDWGLTNKDSNCVGRKGSDRIDLNVGFQYWPRPWELKWMISRVVYFSFSLCLILYQCTGYSVCVIQEVIEQVTLTLGNRAEPDTQAKTQISNPWVEARSSGWGVCSGGLHVMMSGPSTDY